MDHMEFRIVDTFTDSLARLTGEEQKAVKTAAFDLQLNPAHPGLQLHRLEKSQDPNFLSVRVTRDVRLIVHRTGASFLLCYVNHHDQAYQWAERRRLEAHPKTGAAQLVEIRERVQEITVPKYVETETPRPALFGRISDEQLLSYGVPKDWLEDVKATTTEDGLLDLAQHLPAEASEALLMLAIGGTPKPDVFLATEEPTVVGSRRAYAPLTPPDPFKHPDAQRRFRVVDSAEELQHALDYPWEKWAVFLHPAQRQLVQKNYSGPARVSGSAGTGKTIVALHRAVYLARNNPSSRVLLTTFSDILSNALRARLRLLIGSQPRLGEQIEVLSMDAVGQRLYELNLGKPAIAASEDVRQMIQEAAGSVPDAKFSLQFLISEWEQVVDAWQLDSWEEYRDVTRLGRRTRLKEPQRAFLWRIFQSVRAHLAAAGEITRDGLFNLLAQHYRNGAVSPFDFAVVDEAQDVSIAQLRFLAAIGGQRPNALFFAGDLGQRIFQQPFSWKALGVDIRGRSSTLRINYRTSHQIRAKADLLLEGAVSDVDGNTEERKGTISLFNGPEPQIEVCESSEEEALLVARWLAARIEAGCQPDEIAIFVRSPAQLPRAESAAKGANLASRHLDHHVETTTGKVAISTMHLAKGLEFRAIAVMACDDEVLPLQGRVETIVDDSELEDVFNTERQLLYVACTRARDFLLVSGTTPASEFLTDLRA
jgi:superfamily I DNA/RNA helicase